MSINYVKNPENASYAIIAPNNTNASGAFSLFFILSSGDLCFVQSCSGLFTYLLIGSVIVWGRVGQTNKISWKAILRLEYG